MLASLASAQPDGGSEWPHYGNDAGGARYSPAAQIDRTNVSQLQIAWTFRTGALGHSAPLDRKAAFEATPILVEGKLFLSTPYNHVIALDPRTGARLWEYDAALDRSHGYSEVTSRGLAAWRDTAASPARRAAPASSWARSTPGSSRWTPTPARPAPASARAARSIDGRQYLVIAAGGHGKLGTKLGDYVVAFTLP